MEAQKVAGGETKTVSGELIKSQMFLREPDGDGKCARRQRIKRENE